MNSKTFMIDTGAPTFFFSNITSLIIDGKTIFGTHRFMSKDEMVNSFGMIVDGFLGCDAITKLGSIEVDRINNTVSFEPSTKEKCNKCQINNFEFLIKINGTECKGYLDTGAPIVGVKSIKVLNRGTLIDEHYIEYTNTGPHETKLFNGTIEFNNSLMESKMFYLTSDFLSNSCDVFLH